MGLKASSFWRTLSLLIVLSVACVSSAMATELWKMDYETEYGFSVSDGMDVYIADYVLDGYTALTDGSDPNARLVANYGSGSGDVVNTLTYAAYGTSVDAIPTEINPDSVTGSYCLQSQIDNSTGGRMGGDWYMDTRIEESGILSNSGNASDFLTMETYFNLQEDMVQSVPSEYYEQLSRTLLTQRRANYNQGRIALGLGVKDNPDGEDDIPVLAIYYANAAQDEYPHILGTTEISQDQWYHAALTLDTEEVEIEGEMVTQRNINVYLNGKLEFSVLGLGEATDVPDAVDTLYPTGSSSRSFVVSACNAATNRSFVGYMDSVRISDEAMDPEDFYCGAPETPEIPGDANNDGKVDGSDVTILAGNWQVGVGGVGGATWEMGDFNGDGAVDGSDVTILAGNWQHGVTASAATAVPEPNTMLMLLAAVIGMLCYRIKK